MNKKMSKIYLVIATIFFAIGFFYVLNHRLVIGLMYIALCLMYIRLHYSIIKKQTLDVSIDSKEFRAIKKDSKFNELLSQGKRIKAIKRCRMVTGCGLKTAQDYVDSKL